MVSKIKKYITYTKYCSDLGFNNCTVKKKSKMVSNGRQQLRANLISLTDSHGKENTAKETSCAAYTLHNSDALAFLITLENRDIQKNSIGRKCVLYFPL
jgi:hypothetical protein